MVTVNTEAYYHAAGECQSIATELATAVKTLTPALVISNPGMAGDGSAASWATKCDQMSVDVLNTIGALGNALTKAADVFNACGYNWDLAEWTSAGKTTPQPDKPAAVGSWAFLQGDLSLIQPSGGDNGAGLVTPPLMADMVRAAGQVPNGDTQKLSAMGAAWTSFSAAEIVTTAGGRLDQAAGKFHGIEAPEVGDLLAVLSTLSSGAQAVASVSAAIGKAVGNYANDLGAVRELIAKNLQPPFVEGVSASIGNTSVQVSLTGAVPNSATLMAMGAVVASDISTSPVATELAKPDFGSTDGLETQPMLLSIAALSIPKELGNTDDNKPVFEVIDSHRYDSARVHASAMAFAQIFGHPPQSGTDWETAEVLNPNSYDPKYHGVGPQIQVVRINPVKGQGVVRSDQFIAQRDVSDPQFSNPFERDLGNNRTFDPNFDPEHAKVATYVDYENGIVVMRQDPSVRQDTGETKVGKPTGTVTQAADGSVRISYDAGNPLAETTWMPGHHKVTVNGDLVFTPGTDGVTISGTRTDYPSMEAYQDHGVGTQIRTVGIDPAASGSSLGPATNLPFHHNIGAGPTAFDHFKDLPSTEFGSVENPPAVPGR
ncbi:hypothetical protein GPX89_28175 [Nocardia sp. ET3-3]|uniref:Uncharacterized protein n=1 Tax=Nocardia terrae TaxID=2675851 RepID=A0A7K1V3K1_9NOCA|nr:hypothetical protein [Nocardia terrae]MVU81111.1 hypothetical protein [Nocardia terrae]